MTTTVRTARAGTRNLVPGRYRGVAVARVDVPLTADALTAHFLGREVYRRTRFVVARHGGRTAVLRVERAPDPAEPLFAPVTAVEVLAGPDETADLHVPEADTAIPSALTAAAARVPWARAVVVQGRYEHVNFVLDPDPLRITVRDVVPPRPAKLYDQAARVLAVTEDLPPITLVAELTDLAALARTRPAAHYLLPCRGGGNEVPGAELSYLDERPPRADWTLVGCARSAQIHRWFYGGDAPRIDFCPASPPAPGLLTRCCLHEDGPEYGPDRVTVPWGASLAQVTDALRELARRLEPAWAPA